MSLFASPTLMAVPSSRKTIMSKTSTDDFTKFMLNNPQLSKSSQAMCSGEECGFFFLSIPKLEMQL